MVVLDNTYVIIIYCGIIAPGHGKEVVDGLNDVDKSYIYQRHAVFHSFLSHDNKQDAATTTAHRKLLVSLLKNKQVLTT